MTKAETIAQRYAEGYITPAQLDGTGAAHSVEAARNYVALGVITQAQADSIKVGQAETATEMAQALQALGVNIDG